MPRSICYSESAFENAVIELFIKNDYEYENGYDIHRTNEEILLRKDFIQYLTTTYKNLCLRDDEINYIIHNLLMSKGVSLYNTMKFTLNAIRDGINLDRSKYGLPNVHIDYFDFDNSQNNIFKIVNQYEVKDLTIRRPDLVVFINGIPVSVFELKNLSDSKVKIYDAYKQICIRYTRDIENLMRFSFISVISDGINTKYGSLFSDYKHFFPWKSVDGIKYSKDGIESLYTMIKGMFGKETILNILKNYVYFPDNSKKELMVLPKYSQYYASELLFENVKKHIKPKGDGRGGTYFGATGCGKSYTMLFLSRRITLCKDLKSPTIVLLTDRNDLDDQLSQLFVSSKQFLVDNNTVNISNREELISKLKNISSGGIYLLTVQKFDDEVKLLSDRTNIICISDEAHRTQVNLDAKLDISENGIKKHFGFAKYLRDSFPNATYVGFTGTPIDKTVQVFGDIVASYKMKQAVDDGSTVGIDLLPGPSSVMLDENKLAIVDKYYNEQLSSGTNKYEVNESIKNMAKVRTIIDNESRLDLIVKHFINHYELRVKEGSTVCGKAMFVCYDRKIAYKLYKKIIELRPEWNKKKKTQLQESKLSYEQLNKLKPIEMVKLIATRNKDDEPDLYDLLGTSEDRSNLATLFKDENSNFKIAIVVDMWITGFDCECLDTMYIDKPLERHTLIQTISRVNRIFEGKDKGLIVDYIGLESSLVNAMKLYSNGDVCPVSETEMTYAIFKDNLKLLDQLMHDFDKRKFETGTDLERLKVLNDGIEFVQFSQERENQFMGLTLRLKKAYDLIVGDNRITESELFRVYLYCAIRSGILKMTYEGRPDAERMNQEVKKLVDSCIKAMSETREGSKKKTEIFSEEYLKKIQGIPRKNTKFRLLIELIKKAIKDYSKTNQFKAQEFSKRMKTLVNKYNNRDATILVSNNEVVNDFLESLSDEAQKILSDLKADSEEFKKMGITFEEKAFFDILKAIRDKYKFPYPEDKLIVLSKKIKEIVDDKSKYTDWSSKSDIRASFQSDIIRVLNKNGYPPMTFEDVYQRVLSQVENFKKYN